MKLYLSSFRFGNRPEELTKFAGAGTKVAVIANARDYQARGHRAMRCAEEAEKLRELGFEADELDLRDYFGKQKELKQRLQGYGMVWISGERLRVALSHGTERSRRNTYCSHPGRLHISLPGTAQPAVLAPSLDAYAIVDDPKRVQTVYGLAARMDGLGILEYYFEPHYKSDHPESAAVDEEIAQLDAKKLSYLALSDGEVLIINGDGSEETVIS